MKASSIRDENLSRLRACDFSFPSLVLEFETAATAEHLGYFELFARFRVFRGHDGLFFNESLGRIVAVGAPQVFIHGRDHPS